MLRSVGDARPDAYPCDAGSTGRPAYGVDPGRPPSSPSPPRSSFPGLTPWPNCVFRQSPPSVFRCLSHPGRSASFAGPQLRRPRTESATSLPDSAGPPAVAARPLPVSTQLSRMATLGELRLSPTPHSAFPVATPPGAECVSPFSPYRHCPGFASQPKQDPGRSASFANPRSGVFRCRSTLGGLRPAPGGITRFPTQFTKPRRCVCPSRNGSPKSRPWRSRSRALSSCSGGPWRQGPAQDSAAGDVE